MNQKLIVEPEKLITNSKCIEEIVNAVSERMDEPGLKGKIIKTFVLPKDEMIKVAKKVAEVFGYGYDIPEEDYHHVRALYFPLGRDMFTVFLKENTAPEIIPSYFHELGHIATAGLTNNKDMPSQAMIVLGEMTANAFMCWSIEELDSTTNLQYPSVPLILLKELRFQLQNNLMPIARAATGALVWQYIAYEFKQAREAYHWCKEVLQDKERLTKFCQEIEEIYLRKSK